MSIDRDLRDALTGESDERLGRAMASALSAPPEPSPRRVRPAVPVGIALTLAILIPLMRPSGPAAEEVEAAVEQYVAVEIEVSEWLASSTDYAEDEVELWLTREPIEDLTPNPLTEEYQ